MRIVLGILVLVVAGWLLNALVGSPEPSGSATAGPSQWTSSNQCRECHEEVFQEWLHSPHANSWNNEDVRVQSEGFSNKVCIDCHAPRPVWETGVGERVMPRSSRRAEGVDCLTCHLLPDGRIAGTIDNQSAPCRPVARRELQRVDFCAGCHDQHKTVQQWKETPLAEEGIGCIQCHMPYRGATRESGRLHTMPGGHYMEFVRTAVELTGEPREGGGFTVTVANVGAGHTYPTDERSRASDVWWRPLPADPDKTNEHGVAADGGAWRHLHRIRDPYRNESHLVSTLLQYGERRPLDIEDPDAAEGVEVALVYKRTPYYRDPATGEPLRTEDVTDPFIDSELVHRVVLRP